MVIVVVLALLVILGAWAFSMSFYSQSTTQQSARAQYTERCTDFAEMALAETMHAIRIRVNDPNETLLFTKFRESKPQPLKFGNSDIPRTMDAASGYKGYTISDVIVEVPRRTSIGVEAEERVPYEAVGITRLAVTVTGHMNTKVTKVVEYGFRSVLTAPPRPLDMLSFFIADPRTLLVKGAFKDNPNDTIDFCLRLMADRKRFYTEWVPRFKDLAKTASDGGFSSQASRINAVAQKFQDAATFQANRPGFWPVPDWIAVQPGESSRDKNKLHKFAWPICVYTNRPKVELSHFNLPNIVGPRVKSVIDSDTPMKTLGNTFTEVYDKYKNIKSKPAESEINADVSRVEKDSETHFKLVHNMARDLDAIMNAYKIFQDDLIEVGGKERERIFKRIRRLEAREQPWRNHYHFTGAGAAKKATKFINQDPPPSGVVFVEDPEDALIVNISNLAGRLQLITQGDMIVESATVQDLNRDVLILISYGELDLRSQVNAAVISWGGKYAARGEPIVGSLIMNNIPEFTSLAAIEDMFSAPLTFQPKLRSGPEGNRKRAPPDPDTLHIAFGPMPPYRRPTSR